MRVTPMDSRGWIVNIQAQASPPHRQPVLSIELDTPASLVVIPMIRAVAADLAAHASFEVDSSDDLRMTVDDACSIWSPSAGADHPRYTRRDGAPVGLMTAADAPGSAQRRSRGEQMMSATPQP